MMQHLKVVPQQFSDIIDENGRKKKLGRSGFLGVFEKKWMLDEHHVAVKVMEVKTYDEESSDGAPTSGLSRLFDHDNICWSEVRTQAKVYHPNLHPVLCYTVKKRSDAMEFSLVSEVMLSNLNHLIERRRSRNRNIEKAPFPLHVAIDIMLQLAKGMEYLHQLNIMHRDLTPSNILISPDSILSPLDDNRLLVRVKVADFGLSKAIDYNTSELQCHTPHVGTSIWRAPEVLESHHFEDIRYNKKVDVYSFAMVCYEILTGEFPFRRERSVPSIWSKLLGKIKEEHYRPRFDNGGSSTCPEALIDMIRKWWHPKPSRRPNFSQIARDLRYMKVCAIRLAGYEEDDELENRLKQMCKESRRNKVEEALEEGTAYIYRRNKVEEALEEGKVGALKLIDALDDTLKSDLFDLVTLNLMEDSLAVVDEEDDHIFWWNSKNKVVVESILGDERMQSLIDLDLLEDDRLGGIECLDAISTLVKSTLVKSTRMVHDSDGDELRIDIDGDEQEMMQMDPDDLEKIVCLKIKIKKIADVQQLIGMKRLRYAIIEFDCAMSSSPSAEIDFPKLRALRLQRPINRNDRDPVLKLKTIPELRLLIARHDVLDLCQSPSIFSAANLQFLLISDCTRQIHLDLNLLPSLRHLCIERCHAITAFPSPLGNSSQQFLCTSLQTLQIRRCEILEEISNTIHKFLMQLTDLSIAHCPNLLSLPEDIFKNLGSTLSKLDLRLNKLEMLPDGISVLTSLEELDLSSCGSLKSLPQGMGCLSSLEKLDLTECVNLMNLPGDIFEKMGSSLMQLNLLGCQNLEMLPDGISVLTSLEELDLSKCRSMKSLPKGMGCLSSLQKLDLTQCVNLMNLPDGMGCLSRLRILDLSGCFNLKNLPRDIFQEMGNSLKKLNLNGCKKLEMLPEGISVLTSLTQLDLSKCGLMKSLPEGMGCLSSLPMLDLRKCVNLKNLPDGMFKNMGRSLKELYLNGCNSLEMLPEGISVLTSLTDLHLSKCGSMKSLPQPIRCLSLLQILDLNKCVNLKNLPDGMFENMGSSLKKLNLSGCNSLEMLPKGISVLTSLIELDLSKCRSMKSLPQGMECLTSLQILDLRNCDNLKKISLPNDMLMKMGRGFKISDFR